ncbi:hypothetical protein JCM8547_006581 [Rhodosporidiobolus lusitaniae]
MDRLPAELVIHILQPAAPPEFHPRLYRSRRRTLRTVCLVCKRLRNIAQPMLAQVVHAEHPDIGKSLGVVENGETSACRVLVLVVERYEATVSSATHTRAVLTSIAAALGVGGLLRGPVELPQLLLSCSNLVELSIMDVPFFDFAWLRPLSPRRPTSTLASPPADLVLPSLVELSVRGATFPHDGTFFETLPSPATLPSLRALGLSDFEPAPWSFIRRQLRLPFLAQLDFLQVRFLIASFKTERFAACAETFAERLAVIVDALTSFNDATILPRSLILPSPLLSGWPKPGFVSDAVDILLGPCEERGIEVFWEEFKGHYESEVPSGWEALVRARKERVNAAEGR